MDFCHETYVCPTINYYGCCKCQTNHYEGDALYKDHLGFQSKHGINRMPERIAARELKGPFSMSIEEG